MTGPVLSQFHRIIDDGLAAGGDVRAVDLLWTIT